MQKRQARNNLRNFCRIGIYWRFSFALLGDVDPVHCENNVIDEKIETVSKEPDLKYRVFFINDKWPCFGTWANGQFGGFNAKMYDHVFKLLLRLKGNYLWSAMWSASFALDRPGNLNEELADIYSVVIGSSHHEPCLRASEELGKTKRSKSKYGKDWNFYTNKKRTFKIFGRRFNKKRKIRKNYYNRHEGIARYFYA